MLAGRTTALGAARYTGTTAHKQSQTLQQKHACSQKSRACWTFARGCEACAAICCDCNLWKPRTQYTEKIFCHSIKKSKTKELFYNSSFRKVVIYNSTPDALLDSHTSRYKRPHNRPYYSCLWEPAERNKICTSIQLRLPLQEMIKIGLAVIFSKENFTYKNNVCGLTLSILYNIVWMLIVPSPLEKFYGFTISARV